MKKISVLGTGSVAFTLASKLISLGYLVKIGSRSANNEKAQNWVKEQGPNASNGTSLDAVNYSNFIINCCKGEFTIDLFKSLGNEVLKSKTVLDLSNPLDFSSGMPPILIPNFTNTSSLAEQLQAILPDAYIVKTLNIVSAHIMVNPSLTADKPTMFVSGNQLSAKEETINLLKEFGWEDILDLGDISSARGLEMLLPLWLRVYMATNNGSIAFKLLR